MGWGLVPPPPHNYGGKKPVNQLRQNKFRIFNSIIAQCISITIPASPNLVPRLLQPMLCILGHYRWTPLGNDLVPYPFTVPMELIFLIF